ncbi:MAG: protein translocase subunit SecF, partial [Candidatus Yanofskybacteria bacterium]|nr:protein translocase subunit SecF [Candidatus Yanofskybacteria bacterium]
KFRNLYFAFSGILLAGSLGLLAAFGLNFGIEFTGGSLLQVEYEGERPAIAEAQEQLAGTNLGPFLIQPVGDAGMILRMQTIDSQEHELILASLGEKAKEQKFESIGPVIGTELRNKTFLMLALSALAITFYIGFAFRRLSAPLKSWQYSLASFFPLFHDMLIPLGVLALLGYLQGAQVGIPIVVALLTVLGYSINNTVVTFDRIRELLLKKEGANFQEIMNASLSQTMSRNINTSLTTLLVLGCLFLFGGETLSLFALTLMIGITAGTYSSLFLAPSLLFLWGKSGNIDN